MAGVVLGAEQEKMGVWGLENHEFLTPLLAVLREEGRWRKFGRQTNKQKGTDAFLVFMTSKLKMEYYTRSSVCDYSGSFGGK